MTRTREVPRIRDVDAGLSRARRRRVARPGPVLARCLAVLGAGALLVALGAPGAFADDNDSDQGTGGVTVSVTIGPFDPCAVHSPDCSQLPTLALPDPLGQLVASGSQIGVPLTAGVMLAAAGTAVVVTVARRRRRASDQA